MPRELSPRALEARLLRESEKKKQVRVKQKVEPPKPKVRRTGASIGATRKPIKQFEKHEHASAKGYSGGRLTPGSGNKHIKGDVDTPLFRQENKCTSKKQYTIKAEVWIKIESEARNVGKTPVYAFQMDGTPPLAIIEERNLQDMHNELIELRKFKEKHGG